MDEHGVAGSMRTFSLPSAEVAGDGRVYVAWQDCRFRSGCPANDIVYSSSLDGLTWSAVTRIPIDPTNSNIDHFLPGIAVDKSTSGNTTHLAVGYYYFPVSNCTNATCELTFGFVSSLDAGATWTTGRAVTGPMRVTWIANTNQGRMVGDYTSTSFTGDGKAHTGLFLGKASRQQRELFAYDRLSAATVHGVLRHHGSAAHPQKEVGDRPGLPANQAEAPGAARYRELAVRSGTAASVQG